MIDQEKIKKQAKKIMDDFMLALDKVRDIEERFGVDREQEVRKVKGKPCSPEQFRKKMLNNAPKIKDNCILAEKKKW